MYQVTNIYVLAGVGTIGGALFGFDISSMSAWIGTHAYLDYFNSPDENLQGGITASMSAGSWLGALLAGWMSDRWGRKGALQIASVVWIIGSMVTCSAQNVGHLIAGRVINGICVGITSSQTPVYLAELSNHHIRGRIVGIQQWAIEWGILIMYFVSYGCSFIYGPASFRLAWGLQAVPAAILLGALPFFPESPRWLASKDRWEDSLHVLAVLHGEGNESDPLVQAEYEEVREAQRIEAEAAQTSWFGLFGPTVWKRTTAGVFVQIWQQLLGGNVMMYYIVYLFQMAGLTGNLNLQASSIQYVIFLVTTAVTIALIDRIGRRPLLIYGSITMGALNFAVAGLMSTYGKSVDGVDGNKNIVWQVTGSPAKGIIACVYLFVAVYGFTCAPGAWIYMSEVFPLRHRAKGVGLATSSNWAFNFALAYFVPPAFHNIVWRVFIIFGIFCFTGALHTFLMFPETCGKTLEEIDAIFEPGVRAWETSKFESRLDARVHDIEAKAGDQKVEVSEKI